MKIRKTSRVLNDESFFLGLSYNDITALACLVLVLMFVAKLLETESKLWVLAIAIFLLIVLIPIRMRYRRKILRDSVKYIFLQGVSHVSPNSKLKCRRQ